MPHRHQPSLYCGSEVVGLISCVVCRLSPESERVGSVRVWGAGGGAAAVCGVLLLCTCRQKRNACAICLKSSYAAASEAGSLCSSKANAALICEACNLSSAAEACPLLGRSADVGKEIPAAVAEPNAAATLILPAPLSVEVAKGR